MGLRYVLALCLLLVTACQEPTTPTIGDGASSDPNRVPPGVTATLWGSTSLDATNPASLFTIDEATGAATLVGSAGIPEGSDRISAIDFDPSTGVLYGIKGGPCYGAILLTLDPATGAGTIVDTLMGGWFDGTPEAFCSGGSAGIAFANDGTLYASGWYGGTFPQGNIMKVDKETGTVLELHPTPIGYGDWKDRRAHLNGLAFDADGTLWASRGNSLTTAQINTVDPTTGDITSTLLLIDPLMEDSVTISDLAFGLDGMLYASLPWEGMLATIDTSTGDVTRVGSFAAGVTIISGLTAVPRLVNFLLGRYWFDEAQTGQGPTTVADDQANPVDLTITYDPSMAWTLQDSNRGLRSSAFSHNGKVTGTAEATKYDAALDLANQATFVYVVSWLDPPYIQAIGGFQNYHPNFPDRVVWLQTDDVGIPSVVITTEAQSEIDVRWPPSLADDTRRVFHVVYDSDDAVPERRIRLYVDGVDQGYGTLSNGTWPALGEGLDFGSGQLQVQLMNLIERNNSWPIGGTVFYFAVFETTLTDQEIAGNAAALLTGDDGPP